MHIVYEASVWELLTSVEIHSCITSVGSNREK